jgi:hypothetical protein
MDIAAHLVLFAYGAIIASAIYSLPTAGGIVLGTFLALPISGVNWLNPSTIVRFFWKRTACRYRPFYFGSVFFGSLPAAAVPPPRIKTVRNHM